MPSGAAKGCDSSENSGARRLRHKAGWCGVRGDGTLCGFGVRDEGLHLRRHLRGKE